MGQGLGIAGFAILPPFSPIPANEECLAEALSYPMGGHSPPREERFCFDDELPISLDPVLKLGRELSQSSRVWWLKGLVVVSHGDAILCVRARS